MDKICITCNQIHQRRSVYCNECILKRKKKYHKNYGANYYIENKEYMNQQAAEYRKNNREKEKLRHSTYFQCNKEEIYNYRNDYYSKHPDKKYMLKLRQRLNKYYISGKNHYQLINCDGLFLRKWFQFHFELDHHLELTHENHGEKWHIDHVIPCSYFNMNKEKDQEICFHWSNLRPLPIIENLSKNNSINDTYIQTQNERLRIFCEKENISICQISLF